MARIPYQVYIDGKPCSAKVSTMKDRFGNQTYMASVVDAQGNTLAQGYGDSPYEACDAAGGR